MEVNICILMYYIVIDPRTVLPFFSASDTALVPPNPTLFTLVMLKVYRGHQWCVTYWYPSLVVLMCVSVVPSSDEICIMYMRGTPASVLRCIRMLEVDRDGSAVKLTGCEVTNWSQQSCQKERTVCLCVLHIITIGVCIVRLINDKLVNVLICQHRCMEMIKSIQSPCCE